MGDRLTPPLSIDLWIDEIYVCKPYPRGVKENKHMEKDIALNLL
jgi:hypothetical protein